MKHTKTLTIVIFSLLMSLMVVMPLTGAIKSFAYDGERNSFAQTSKSALLIDADSETVIYEKNTKEHLPIASMVKIMTLCVAFEEIESRQIPFDETVVASENAASMGGSQAFLDANANYSLDELLKSIVVASANDSCVAISEYLFGSVNEFVDRMNERAKNWGMNDTVFVNCTGLPQEGQYSCASDVAIMFKKLMKYDKFFEYAKTWTYKFKHPSGRTTELTNTNKLIRFYDGCDGGKTGYTNEARSCVTVTAQRGDTRYICVVIGAENSKTRNKEVSELLNYGFANYSTKLVLRQGECVGDFSVVNGKVGTIKGIAENDCAIFVKNGSDCAYDIVTNVDTITAPVLKGDVIGKISIIVDNKEYKTINLIADSNCEQKEYGDIVKDFIKRW